MYWVWFPLSIVPKVNFIKEIEKSILTIFVPVEGQSTKASFKILTGCCAFLWVPS